MSYNDLASITDTQYPELWAVEKSIRQRRFRVLAFLIYADDQMIFRNVFLRNLEFFCWV